MDSHDGLETIPGINLESFVKYGVMAQLITDENE
jgi:hypothetical protein